MRIREITRHPEAGILLCLALAAPFLLTPWVNADGIGYFGFLHSAVFDRDLELSNQFAYLAAHISADAGGLPGRLMSQSERPAQIHAGYHTPPRDPVTGRTPSNFSVGPALFWTPAYLLAHAVVRAGNLTGLGHRQDGYGGLYYLSFALTSLLCGALGLLLALRLARRVASGPASFWATLGIAAASPLLYYLYFAPSYAHALTALTAGLFLYDWYTHRNQAGAGVWFRWGALTGLLFLVRWSDVVVALPVLAVAAARLLQARTPDTARRRALRLLGHGAAALGGFLLVASVQFGVWQYLHGRPWVRHSVPTLEFNPQALWGAFLSARHGLFQWHPITIGALLGLLLLLRRERLLACVSLAVLGLLVLANGLVHDWWGGSGFGMRRLVSATPVLIIGLASCFEALRGALERVATRAGRIGRQRLQAARFCAPAVVAVLGVWNLLLLAQYGLGLFDRDASVPLTSIAANQLDVIARLWRALIGLLP